MFYFKIYFPLKFKMVDSRVRLWPNAHFFDAGIVQSHEKLNLINSERIIKYSMTKVILKNLNLAQIIIILYFYLNLYIRESTEVGLFLNGLFGVTWRQKSLSYQRTQPGHILNFLMPFKSPIIMRDRLRLTSGDHKLSGLFQNIFMDRDYD